MELLSQIGVRPVVVSTTAKHLLHFVGQLLQREGDSRRKFVPLSIATGDLIIGKLANIRDDDFAMNALRTDGVTDSAHRERSQPSRKFCDRRTAEGIKRFLGDEHRVLN